MCYDTCKTCGGWVQDDKDLNYGRCNVCGDEDDFAIECDDPYVGATLITHHSFGCNKHYDRSD